MKENSYIRQILLKNDALSTQYQLDNTKKNQCFFPRTIWVWNDHPDSLISSAQVSGDCMSKFTSLVRAGNLFPPVTVPGEESVILAFHQ